MILRLARHVRLQHEDLELDCGSDDDISLQEIAALYVVARISRSFPAKSISGSFAVLFGPLVYHAIFAQRRT